MTWIVYADTWYLLFITWIRLESAPLCQFNWLFYMFPDHSKCNKIWFEDASASGGTISHSHTALEHSRVRLLASSRGSSPSSSPPPSPGPWPWPPCRRGQWGGRRWGPRPPPAGDTPTQGGVSRQWLQHLKQSPLIYIFKISVKNNIKWVSILDSRYCQHKISQYHTILKSTIYLIWFHSMLSYWNQL